MSRVTLVVPCFNEALRLHTSVFVEWLAHHDRDASTQLLFVDDGSTDDTAAIVRKIAADAPAGRASVLVLERNQGKAEAVRRGMVHAMETTSSEVVGFWDSDLATPLDAVPLLTAVLFARPQVQMVFGARVALLGRRISRSPVRHYLGRVFATLASLCLDLPIYDTQCGAKLFRVTPLLRTVVARPFLTRWVFDCEMIARYAALMPPAAGAGAGADGGGGGGGGGGGEKGGEQGGRGGGPLASPLLEAIYEFPLEEWVDVAGSKVKPADILRMALGLLRIRLVYVLHSWPDGRRKPELWTAVALVGVLAALAALLAAAAAGALWRAL